MKRRHGINTSHTKHLQQPLHQQQQQQHQQQEQQHQVRQTQVSVQDEILPTTNANATSVQVRF